jgi:Ca2+-binding RTX toxin-like protein
MNADDNTINGNGGNDKINGGGGDDKLYGGSGKDALVGGSGKDMFVFNTKLGATNVDTIGDFSVKKDKIVLDDDVFKAGKVGDLSSGAFSTGTKAQDASDRIIYDKASGKLWYDADGSGSGKAVLFGVLDKGLNLTAGDFDIIS